MSIFKIVLDFLGLFFNCGSIVFEVSEPIFSFFKDKKTQQNTTKNNKTQRKQQKTEDFCFICSCFCAALKSFIHD